MKPHSLWWWEPGSYCRKATVPQGPRSRMTLEEGSWRNQCISFLKLVMWLCIAWKKSLKIPVFAPSTKKKKSVSFFRISDNVFIFCLKFEHSFYSNLKTMDFIFEELMGPSSVRSVTLWIKSSSLSIVLNQMKIFHRSYINSPFIKVQNKTLHQDNSPARPAASLVKWAELNTQRICFSPSQASVQNPSSHHLCLISISITISWRLGKKDQKQRLQLPGELLCSWCKMYYGNMKWNRVYYLLIFKRIS